MHKVKAKSILSAKNGMNLYRGCTHGCIYCDTRSDCYQFTHPLEDVEVKENAVELLEDTLRRKRKKCMIGTGAMCDPYMPLEAEIEMMRSSLKVIERYGFGVTFQTKSDLALRDMDLFCSINRQSKCVAQVTMTTYDDELCRKLEPNVCVTSKRYEMLKEFQKNGISTVVWLSPFLPWLNDTEENIKGLLEYCLDAGVVGIICFGIGLTLRAGNREYFYQKLDEHFPGLKERYQHRFGQDYECASPNSRKLLGILRGFCRKNHMMWTEESFRYLNTYEEKNVGRQMSLLDILTE